MRITSKFWPQITPFMSKKNYDHHILTAGRLTRTNSFRLIWRILTTRSLQVHATLVKCYNIQKRSCSPNFGGKVGYWHQWILDLFKWSCRRYRRNIRWLRVKVVSLCQQEWLLLKLERRETQLIVLLATWSLHFISFILSI